MTEEFVVRDLSRDELQQIVLDRCGMAPAPGAGGAAGAAPSAPPAKEGIEPDNGGFGAAAEGGGGGSWQERSGPQMELVNMGLW